MSITGALLTLTVVGLAVIHALLESRAFARVWRPGDAGVLGGAPTMDRLWLASCLAFAAFEGAAVFQAAQVEQFSLAQCAAACSGALACMAGARLRSLAIDSLGAAFAEPPFASPAPALAVNGVFAIVRHPSELGLLLFCAGLVAITSQPVMLAVFAASILFFMGPRIIREERWLKERFPGQHAAYRRICPRLIWPAPDGWPPLCRLIARPNRGIQTK